MKTSITNLGKRNYDDFNTTKTKLESLKKSSQDFIDRGIKFFNKKHKVVLKKIEYKGEKQTHLKTLFDDIELHTQISEYDGPEQYVAPKATANNIYESEILLLGPKISATQLKQLSNLIVNFINYVNNAKKSVMTKDSEMLIIYAWVILFIQITDTLFDKKNILKEYESYFATTGYPLDKSDENFEDVYNSNKNKSILAYMSLFFMNKFQITKVSQKDVMNGLFNRINDILRFQPDIAKKLMNSRLIKVTKTTQNDSASKYLKMFKPFNQNISSIDLNKNVKQKTDNVTVNAFNVSYSIYIPKLESIKKSVDTNTINQKIKRVFDIESRHQANNMNENNFNVFLGENKWIPESLLAILSNEGDVDYALAEYLQYHMQLLFDYLGNENIDTYFNNLVQKLEEDNTDLIKLLDIISKLNINTYISDVIHPNKKNHLYKFVSNYSNIDIFFENKDILQKYCIQKIDLLIKTNMTTYKKNYILLTLLISSLVSLYNELFTKDIPVLKTFEEMNEIIDEEMKLFISNFNKFILSSIEHKIDARIVVDKEILRRKYNLLRSEERQKENTETSQMTDEEIDLYFAYKKLSIPIENSAISQEVANESNDIDYGDGDGDNHEYDGDV